MKTTIFGLEWHPFDFKERLIMFPTNFWIPMMEFEVYYD